MKELKYYKFEFYSSQFPKDDTQEYGVLRADKLYSELTHDSESESNIGKKLFFPKGNNYYAAHQQIPKDEVVFYDFYIEENRERLGDFMQAEEINSVFGFFVSKECKKLLEKHRLPSHRYHPVKIYFKEEAHDDCYYYLLIAKEELKINYLQSRFVDMFDETEIIPIKKYQDLLQLNPANENAPSHYTNEFVVEKSIVFDEVYDIYPALTNTSGFFYFSEVLKKALVNARMTGYLLHEIETPKFFL